MKILFSRHSVIHEAHHYNTLKLTHIIPDSADYSSSSDEWYGRTSLFHSTYDPISININRFTRDLESWSLSDQMQILKSDLVTQAHPGKRNSQFQSATEVMQKEMATFFLNAHEETGSKAPISFKCIGISELTN